MERKPFQCKIETYWRIITPVECRIKPCESSLCDRVYSYTGFFVKILRIFPSSKKGTGVIREKIPYKCKINTYWRIKPLKCSYILASFWKFLKISPSSGRGTGVIMERLPYQCKMNIYWRSLHR